jgi:CDP-6-deoxy-D-xylo-4-hexulose-3-dehydrase
MVNKRFVLAEDTIDQKDIQELISWLEGGPWLTQGTLVKEFERQWAEWLGVRFSVAVNSGSSANLLMYYGLLISGKLKNNKVVVPAIGWATTVTPAIQLGFDPIMCEADPLTWGLDPDYLESLVKTHDPGCVILVHVSGMPCQMDQILHLQEKYGFLLMEDCCGAHGSKFDDKLVGTMGDVSTFSFYFGHHISTIEGGMVCTNDEQLADLFLSIRSHGWARELATEKAESLAKEWEVVDFNRPFTFYYPGFNLRTTDLNAKLGLSQMTKLNQVVETRIRNHISYQDSLQSVPGIGFQRNPRGTTSSISFPALAANGEHRERIGRALREHGIETRPVGGGNMSRQPFWVRQFGAQEFPMADRVHHAGFQVPNHGYLTSEDIAFICEVVKGASN